MLGDPLVVVARLGAVLEQLGVNHFLVGSLASSMYGVPRSTQGVDLVAVVSASSARTFARELTQALGDEFYADEDAISEAVSQEQSFDVVHQPTLFKADVFVAKSDEWGRLQVERARPREFNTESGPVRMAVASPEDVILHKLHWYRLGGEQSERQLTDVADVLRIQGERIDVAYCRRTSVLLGVTGILERLLSGVEQQ